MYPKQVGINSGERVYVPKTGRGELRRKSLCTQNRSGATQEKEFMYPKQVGVNSRRHLIGPGSHGRKTQNRATPPDWSGQPREKNAEPGYAT